MLATTTATGWPCQNTSSVFSTGTPVPAAESGPLRVANTGVGFMRGAFMCVITSRTPGTAAAATASMATIRPRATVLPTRAAYAMPGGWWSAA